MKRRRRTAALSVAVSMALGATLALSGPSQVAVGTYTYDPGGPCGGAAFAVPNQGLMNMGFETGDFTGWQLGRVADDVSIVSGHDGYTGPNDGQFMARLGSTYGSPAADQPPGPNELCQDFIVDQGTESFAFRIFTWDGDDFDHFQYRLTIVNPATGSLISQVSGGGWGETGALKNTGWQEVTVNLSGLLGQVVRIYFDAGGSSDEFLGTWAYLDSAPDRSPEAKALHLRAGKKKVKKGRRTTLTARMAPCPDHAGDVINFFRRQRQIASVPSDENCEARIRVRVRLPVWFSAESPTDADSLSAVSNSVRVRVKPAK